MQILNQMQLTERRLDPQRETMPSRLAEGEPALAADTNIVPA